MQKNNSMSIKNTIFWFLGLRVLIKATNEDSTESEVNNKPLVVDYKYPSQFKKY
jgi:hypothetical protein